MVHKNKKPIEQITLAQCFGIHLKELRKQRGMTQTDLASKANLEKTAIQRIERGYNSTFKTFCKLAQALEMNLSELFDFEEERR